MGLKTIIEEFEQTPDTLLDDVIKYFQNSDKEMTHGNIQRYFKVGYRRAYRILNQINAK